jgi:hypothetical protein
LAAKILTKHAVETVIERQAQLIAALDAQDAEMVVSAAAALAKAIASLRDAAGAVDHQRLAHGLKQAEAARIRVKYLTAWNRQKIDRLAELRGQSSGDLYAKPRIIG